MKQLLIVNSAKAVKTGVADDLTVLDAGQIGFFHLSPDASGANEGKVTFFNTKPTTTRRRRCPAGTILRLRRNMTVSTDTTGTIPALMRMFRRIRRSAHLRTRRGSCS